MKSNATKTTATYFGLTVEVICKMRHCALIRYGEREFIVDTCDLVFVRRIRCAA
jgi:hypothetical protein